MLFHLVSVSLLVLASPLTITCTSQTMIPTASQLADLATIRQRTISQNSISSVSTATLTSIDTLVPKLIAANGMFDDIDYSRTDRTNWPPMDHISRVLTMARAYRCSSSSNRWYNQTKLLTAMSLAIQYFKTRSPTSLNWWQLQIGVPLSLGPACVLIGPALNATTLAACTKLLSVPFRPGTDTGANLVWTNTGYLYRAIINNDVADAQKSFAGIWQDFRITTGLNDGTKLDSSFFQHGAQLYNGGYGTAFVQSGLTFANIAVNTSFFLSPSQYDALSKTLLDGSQYMMVLRRKPDGSQFPVWDINAKGREITRGKGQQGGFSNVDTTGGLRASEYSLFAARLAGNNISPAAPRITANKLFWQADYMAHLRPNWQSSVRMYSTRTVNSECVNDEGKLSLNLGSNANYLYETGQEYFNIFPMWNWRQIPGTTLEQDGSIPLNCGTAKQTGTSTFAGGISNGNYGATSYRYAGPVALGSALTALKSTFFFDNEYICLGANINSPKTSNVVTTVEQNFWRGDVTTTSTTGGGGSTVVGSIPLTAGVRAYQSQWAIHHDTTGYLFPDVAARAGRTHYNNDVNPVNATVKLSLANITGDWSKIGVGSGTPSDLIFNLAIFRTTPASALVSDSYSYMVVPAVNSSIFYAAAQSRLEAVLIVANNPKLQAVYHRGANILFATFWSATATITKSTVQPWSVSVSQPVMVQIVRPGGTGTTGASYQLIVSDPSRTVTTVTLTFSVRLTGTGCTATATGTTVSYTMPTGDSAGRAVIVTCSEIPPTTTTTTTAPPHASTSTYTSVASSTGTGIGTSIATPRSSSSSSVVSRSSSSSSSSGTRTLDISELTGDGAFPVNGVQSLYATHTITITLCILATAIIAIITPHMAI